MMKQSVIIKIKEYFSEKGLVVKNVYEAKEFYGYVNTMKFLYVFMFIIAVVIMIFYSVNSSAATSNCLELYNGVTHSENAIGICKKVLGDLYVG